jgi:CheY-like chemotaxis protein
LTGGFRGGAAALAQGARTRVLVVEDETLVAMMLEDMLQEIGCTVVGPVGSRSAALRLLDDGGDGLDLALLDVNLGGETAYEIADALTRRGIPFIFVSGYGAGGLDRRYAGAVVLAKPFEPAMLARMIGEVLDRSTGEDP